MSESDPKPVISCIVPCKGAATLRDALASLHDQDLQEPYEIVVVDGWWDDSVVEACKGFPKARIVRSRDNLVPGPARNLGVEHARADIVAFTDSDCVVDRGFLRAAKQAVESGIRLAGGPILDALPWWNVVAATDNFSQFADFPPTRPDGVAEYFPGCNMAMRKADFLEVGGFPNTGMPAGEDTLLCFRVAERFGKDGVRFVNAMRIRHRGRNELGIYLKHQNFFGYCRGAVGMKVKPWQRELGKHVVMAVPISAKRFLYMGYRTLQWHPAGLVRMTLMSPLLMVGMFAFAAGFRRACRQPMVEVK